MALNLVSTTEIKSSQEYATTKYRAHREVQSEIIEDLIPLKSTKIEKQILHSGSGRFI